MIIRCTAILYRSRRQYSLITHLKDRGLVKTVTSAALETTAQRHPISLYCGVDPTAPSLHVGNLLTLIPVLHFYLSGHNVYALVGGATGQVGDPAGKNAERDKLAATLIDHNVKALSSQLKKFISNASLYANRRGYETSRGKAEVVNNADWYANLHFLQFMNDVGRNVRIGSMLARDSVKNRLSGDGMSYGEFSYQLLQAYDFWHLYKTNGVRLQIGGSDQYGNITAGTDLVSRLQDKQEEVFGLTVPLLTTSTGEKFGKSAGNAIWLDPDMTSPFDLYQYMLRTHDDQLHKYLKLFTLLPLEEVDEIMQKHHDNPSKRLANHKLAAEMTHMVHGEDELKSVLFATRLLFPQDFDQSINLTADAILSAFKKTVIQLPRAQVIDQKVTSLLRDCKLVKSGKEASQLISSGGLYRLDERITNPHEVISDTWLIDGEVLLLRKGRNQFLVVQVN